MEHLMAPNSTFLRIKSRIGTIAMFLICLTNFLGCSSEKAIEKRINNFNHLDSVKSLILNIDFQRNFIHDRVSLKLNGMPIFDTVLLTTQRITDFTQFRVNAYSLRNGKTAVSYFGVTDTKIDYTGKIKFLEFNTSRLELTVIVNKTVSKYYIDTSNGRYMNFSKTLNDELTLFQNDRSFIYD